MHEYDEIDRDRVHESLQDAVRDLPQYLRYVSAYLDPTEDDDEKP